MWDSSTSTRTGCVGLGDGACSTGSWFLPSRKQVSQRIDLGLTAPELSVLLAYTKIVLADELIETDLPDDPFLRADLFSYFPSQMRQLPPTDGGAPAASRDHRDPGGQRAGQRRRHHLLPPALR